MKVTRDTSGAISYESDGGGVVWFINPENTIIKNDELNVIVIMNNKVYTWPIDGLVINGVPFVGTAKGAAETVATEVFNG